MTIIAGRQRSNAAAGILLTLVLVLWAGASFNAESQLLLIAAGGVATFIAIASRTVALFLLGLLAAFDGYIAPAVIYRDLLAVDVIGLALIVGELRRGWSSPTMPAPVAAMITLLALLMFHVLSLDHHNWAYAGDNVARFGFWSLVTAAVWSARRVTPVLPACAGLVLGIGARFLYEGFAFLSDAAFVIHPSYQFGRFTSNPNTLAGLGSCVLPVAVALAVTRVHLVLRLAAASIAAALLLGIVMSFSKGAWVALAGGTAILVFHLVRSETVSRRILIRTCVTITIIALAVPTVRRVPLLMYERWTSHGSLVSNEERLRYIDTAAAFIVQQPLSGVGLGRFGENYRETRRLLRGPDDPHNAYLLVGAELGILALGCWILFQLLIVTAAFMAVAKGGVTIKPVCAGVSAATVVLLLFQFFSAEPLTARISWVVMALALSLPSTADERPGDV